MTPVSVLTIGVFDGFHRGHAAVVARARHRADEVRGRLVVLTFANHPRVVLTREGPPPLLTLPGERVGLLRAAGADEVRVLQFNRALSALSPLQFLERYVFPFHRLAALVVGYDFALGKDRAGSGAVLRSLGESLGFEVERVGAEAAGEGREAISSTTIREALASGQVEEGARLLGRRYTLYGSVGTGEGRGRTLGFPTANIQVAPGKLRPGRGVYAVWVRGVGETPRPGVVNIGNRPTFAGTGETVEAFLPDFEGDLRGRVLTLEFLSRLRAEKKFNGPKELADQIREDVALAHRRLAASVPGNSP